MEPIGHLVVGVLLTGTIHILIECIDFVLGGIVTAHIESRFLQEDSVLKRAELLCMILDNLVQNERVALFGSLQNRLDSSAVPIQVLLCHQILEMVRQRLIHFGYDILRSDPLRCCEDVKPSGQHHVWQFNHLVI